jgi:hypothetical protein
VLEGPTGSFEDEIERLRPQAKPRYAAVQSADNPDLQTLEAYRADLQEALDRTPGFLAIQRAAILRNHEQLLERMAGRRADLERLLHGVQSKPGAATAVLTPSKGLLPEFSDYVEGAIAYHDLRLSAAVRAWDRLLQRPADQRHYRSTWAAFMLGKVHLGTDPAAAVKHFQRTRQLAAQGFADRLGLAVSSLGWEAWAESAQGHQDRALVLYDEQRRAGDDSAYASLKLTCAAALAAGPEALDRVARNPEARAILTAWVVSHDPDEGEAWQQALQAAGVRDVDGADRLAWAAYLAGDFDGAAAWLDQAREASPMAKWVHARLLLRDGKLEEGRKLLEEVAHSLPELDLDMKDASTIVYETGEVRAAPQRAAGEEAVVRVTQKDFTGAFDRFLRAGYWLDAAYLGERVLGTTELASYVDANWPADLAAKYKPVTDPDDWDPIPVGGYTAPAPERVARDVRYLLGRRLAREGRYQDALGYLPAERRAALEELSAHVAAGRDRQRPAAERGRELFEAACLLRHQGMELTGTEVEPDWAVVDGEYDLADYGVDRKVRQKNERFVMTADERARLERNRLHPWKRFHYRYRAADLGWEAARLLPTGDEKAGMLATAGSWLKGQDPEAAQRFYLELVRCCGSTDLGRAAEEIHWFPAADACPAETR